MPHVPCCARLNSRCGWRDCEQRIWSIMQGLLPSSCPYWKCCTVIFVSGTWQQRANALQHFKPFKRAKGNDYTVMRYSRHCKSIFITRIPMYGVGPSGQSPIDIPSRQTCVSLKRSIGIASRFSLICSGRRICSLLPQGGARWNWGLA